MKFSFHNNYISLGIYSLIFVAVLTYLIPLSKRTLNIYHEKISLEQINKISEQALQNELELNNLFRSTADKNIVEKSILPESSFLDFIKEIEKLGKEKIVQTDLDFSATQQATKENIIYLPLKLVITGDFHQVLNFIAVLESRDYYLNVQKLNIKPQSSSSGAEVMFNIDFETYWRKGV